MAHELPEAPDSSSVRIRKIGYKVLPIIQARWEREDGVKYSYTDILTRLAIEESKRGRK